MSTQNVQRRLAAIFAVDVLGFSRLMGVDEEDTLARLMALRAELVDPAIARHHGRIFKTTGDGLLAEFPSVVAAVKCAAEVQIAMGSRSACETPEQRIVFRAGINLGDIIVEEDDIYGDGVNIATRIESICQPGGVAISASAYEQVRDKVDFRFVDCGEHQVKNIARPVRVYGLDLSAHGITALGVAARVSSKARIRLWPWGVAATLMLLIAGLSWISSGESTKQIRNALALVLGRTPMQMPSRAAIAVLPLANQSGDVTRDYFSDGVTEDIIGALGRFSGLMVISHNSVQGYKARKAAPAQIGRELGVRYVVQGSVRQANGRLRIAVELSDAENGLQIWSEKYDGEGKDIFEIQDRIVKNIVGVLAVKITSLEAKRTASKPLESLEAYDMVLRARELILRNERGANREARGLGAQAIKLAPDYADGYLTLAGAEWQRAEMGWMEDAEEGVRRSEALTNRALAIGEPGTQARAHGHLGNIFSYRGQFEQALTEVDLATQANPSDADAHALQGSVLLWQGKIEESIAALETSRLFDPHMSSATSLTMSLAYYMADRYKEALAISNTAIANYQNISFLHAIRAATLAELGNIDEASAEAVQVRKIFPFFQVERFGTRFKNPDHQAKIQAGLRKAGL